MIDLSTKYLGLNLKNPLVASPSPLSENLGNIRQMEDSGFSAVVLHSLFEEQITLESIDLDRYLSYGSESFGESLTYFPDMQMYNMGPDGYLEHIQAAKQAVDIPIIASLNGYSSGGWVRIAKQIEEAGADGLELNVYYLASDPLLSGRDVEAMYLALVRNIKASIQIPFALKLSPYFSALAHTASQLTEAGADALVLFNRFYQPDLDIDELEVTTKLTLSTPSELLLRLRWVAILRTQIEADLAITGGVHSAVDVVKSMMAGANIAMMTSAVLKNGISHVASVKKDLIEWMEEREYESIQQMQGSMSQGSVDDPGAFERANYMRVLRSYIHMEN